MPKHIDDLTDDIKRLLINVAEGKHPPVTAEALATVGANIAKAVNDALLRTPSVSRIGEKKLYISELGTQCSRQLWYKLNHPELGEKVGPSAMFKFLYGNVIEELALYLCTLAGHEVSDQQKPTEIKYKGWTIRGRRDATIDGVVVDVKSASPYGFDKIVREGLNDKNDSFGYRAQVSGYHDGEDGVGILAVDKQNGHIAYKEVEYIDPTEMLDRLIPDLESAIPPARTFASVPHATSGNQKLCVECSYCAYKETCWADSNGGKGLVKVDYAAKPIFFTHIKKTPTPRGKMAT
jgi:hypothetical protein